MHYLFIYYMQINITPALLLLLLSTMNVIGCSPLGPCLTVYSEVTIKKLYREQEVGKNYLMHAKVKTVSHGKFVFHRHDFRCCGKHLACSRSIVWADICGENNGDRLMLDVMIGSVGKFCVYKRGKSISVI
jgi:hypothetical protein